MAPDVHVVLGTGPLGLAVIDELVSQGKKVVAVNRSGKASLPEDVPCLKGDFVDAKQSQDLLKNATVAYNCIGLPYQEWEDKLPRIMDNIITAAAENNTKIIYADNLYAYGPQNGPFHEQMSYNPVGIKTKVRADVATKLMEASQIGMIKATIGRGSDFYGPRALNAMLGERVFQHLLDGKPVELIGNPDTLHSHIYVKDFARGLVILADEEKAVGEVWHIPHAKPTSTRQLVEQIASSLSKVPKYRIANKLIVSIMGMFNPVMGDFKEIIYQNINNFTVDSSKFTTQFTFEPTPHEQAIKETSAWYAKQNKGHN